MSVGSLLYTVWMAVGDVVIYIIPSFVALWLLVMWSITTPLSNNGTLGCLCGEVCWTCGLVCTDLLFLVWEWSYNSCWWLLSWCFHLQSQTHCNFLMWQNLLVIYTIRQIKVTSTSEIRFYYWYSELEGHSEIPQQQTKNVTLHIIITIVNFEKVRATYRQTIIQVGEKNYEYYDKRRYSQ